MLLGVHYPLWDKLRSTDGHDCIELSALTVKLHQVWWYYIIDINTGVFGITKANK